MRDVHVDPRLLSRDEEQPELAVTDDRRRHESTGAQACKWLPSKALASARSDAPVALLRDVAVLAGDVSDDRGSHHPIALQELRNRQSVEQLAHLCSEDRRAGGALGARVLG